MSFSSLAWGKAFYVYKKMKKRVKNHIEVKVVENRETMLAFILQKKKAKKSVKLNDDRYCEKFASL